MSTSLSVMSRWSSCLAFLACSWLSFDVIVLASTLGLLGLLFLYGNVYWAVVKWSMFFLFVCVCFHVRAELLLL